MDSCFDTVDVSLLYHCDLTINCPDKDEFCPEEIITVKDRHDAISGNFNQEPWIPDDDPSDIGPSCDMVCRFRGLS